MMKKTLVFCALGLVIMAVYAWAESTNLDRLVLGTGNYGEDPNPTADITMQYDEYITNAVNGTVGIVATTTDVSGLLVAGSGNTSITDATGSVLFAALADTANVARLDQNETIAGNWVNTTSPWADNEVDNAQTISGGTVNSSIIGGSVPAAITGTTITANDQLVVNAGAAITGDTTNEVVLEVTGVASQSSSLFNVQTSVSADKLTVSAAGQTTIADAVLTTADINAGTVDATIGGTTPAAGTFTSVTASGTVQGEQLTSTDDATLTDDLDVGGKVQCGSENVNITNDNGKIDLTKGIDADLGVISTSAGVFGIDDDVILVGDVANGDWGDFSISSNSATLDSDVVTAAKMADGDYGDVSCATNSFTLDNDVVGPDEMADGDHGAFTYTTGVAAIDSNQALTGTTLTANDQLVVNAGTSMIGDTTDEVVLNVKGVGSQSSNLFNVETSGGDDKLSVSAAGVTTAASLTATAFTYGTKVLALASYSSDPNAAAFLVSVPGTDETDDTFVTVNTGPAYLLTADPTVNGVTVTLSADPNESIQVSVMVWQD